MNELPAVTLPEPRPVEWPPPSPALVLKRARTAAEEILAAAEAEAAKLRTESASLRAEVETAVNEAERRKQQTVDEHSRVAAMLDEEVEAGRQAVRLSRERAAQLTEEVDQVLANARQEANRLLVKAQKEADDAAVLLAAAETRGQAAADRQLVAARKEADNIIARANTNAEVVVDGARDEAARFRRKAEQYREELREQEDKKARRDKRIDEWSPRVALTAVVGLTASGEFELAQLAGWPPVIAWLLPLGIDVYVVQALRRHRDVSAALILMVAANAIYHLAAAGLFGVRGGRPEWWLIVGVAAIAPFVMWRLHQIVRPRRERRTKTQGERPEAPAEALTNVDFERVDERPDQEQKALTARPDERVSERPDERVSERPDERVSERPDERVSERPDRAHGERAVSAGSERQDAHSGRPVGRRRERRERAQKKPKASAAKTLTERRRERVRRLYDELGKRPEWTDIRGELVADKLAPKAISRSSCQRVRDAIEADEPALAALGQPNVRAITGS
ncbi:hypothetical protein [Streptomyces sp. NPDC051173]|uniref:hypothetical protein n=1 Tax=Streptomyces sp. NPDC051173 TaxID=3155164 RepID=UPI00344D2B7F